MDSSDYDVQQVVVGRGYSKSLEKNNVHNVHNMHSNCTKNIPQGSGKKIALLIIPPPICENLQKVKYKKENKRGFFKNFRLKETQIPQFSVFNLLLAPL